MDTSASARAAGILAAAAIALTISIAVTAPASAQDYKALGANLMGKNAQGGGAADDASGNFDGEIDFKQSRLCYYLEVDNIGAPTAAAIRKGKGDEGDPVALDLPLPGKAKNGAGDEACAKAATDVLHALAEHPDEYYVDIHTADFTDAALRGRFAG